MTASGSRAVAWATFSFWAFVRGATAQTTTPAEEPPDWAFRGSAYLYLTEDGDYVQPTIAVDHKWLHLEARYNYEDQKTGSMWIGYNFSVGEKVTFQVTPLLGGALGNTSGLGLGCEWTLTWRWLELSSEDEYVLTVGERSDSFFYIWSTLTASPTDWLGLGLVVQRTRAYETSLELQRGFFLGFTTEHVAMTGYVFNPDLHRPTVVLALDINW